MCIRDRAETEDALGRKLAPEDHPLLAEYAMASAGLTSVSLEEAYIEGFRTGARIMSVSYTHLDVYKRQDLETLVRLAEALGLSLDLLVDRKGRQLFL